MCFIFSINNECLKGREHILIRSPAVAWLIVVFYALLEWNSGFYWALARHPSDGAHQTENRMIVEDTRQRHWLKSTTNFHALEHEAKTGHLSLSNHMSDLFYSLSS
jgi:hypothetical protein